MIIDLKKLKLEKAIIRHSLDIYNLIRYVIKKEKKLFDMEKEHFFVLSLNRASYVISLELKALGSNSQVTVDPVESFSLPIYKKAAGIILIHNHPCGTLQPSEEDKDLTDNLIQCGRMLKRPVLDHVIITEHSYYSFKDSGQLECLSNSLKYVPPYQIEEQFHKEMEREVKKLKKQAKIKIEKSLTIGLEKGRQEGEKIGLKKGYGKGYGN